MIRDTATKAAIAIASLIVVSGCVRASTPAPHLVLIVVDTLRKDHVGVYGGKVPTPNIDALAMDGQVFANATAAYHQTSMSMGALFSGRTPSIDGPNARNRLPWTSATWCGLSRFHGQQPKDSCFPDSVPMLAEIMAENGFRTVGISSNMFLYRPAGYDRGFQVWKELGSNLANTETPAERIAHSIRQVHLRTADHVHRELEQTLAAQPVDARLFLYLHYVDVHDYSLLGRSYADSVALMDEKLGDLVEILEKASMLPNATVVFTSDHGERLGEQHAVAGKPSHRGDPSFEEVLDIPLIVRPAIFSNDDKPIRSDQIFTRILEAASVAAPTGITELDPEELYLSEQEHRTYRAGRWKITERRSDAVRFLFDLENDPDERVDVASSHPAAIARLSARLEELSSRLSSAGNEDRQLSEDDELRLLSLGYLD